MDARFGALVETLAPKLELLIRCPPLSYGELPRDMPLSGGYLFSEEGRHLYVGRSNGPRSRYGRHCRPGATHRQAAVAFLLARESTGRTKAPYKAGTDSRAGLMLDPGFEQAFRDAKKRIREMQVPLCGGDGSEPAGSPRNLLRDRSGYTLQRLRHPLEQSGASRVH
jgi:hypothetical protein